MSLERLLLMRLRAAKLPEPAIAYKLHIQRPWIVDYAWPHDMVCLLMDGQEEVRRAAEGLGWLVIVARPRDIRDSSIIKEIARQLESREPW